MKLNKRFDNVLNECLDRMLKGETVEQCLLNYPEQAKELEPLLRTALAARVASTIQPRPEFKAKARYEFQTALRDMAAKKKQRRRFSFSWRPQWQWQTGWGVALVAVIVVALGGGGTVAASSGSMPGDALYSVKLTSEQVQLAVTPSDLDKAELNAKFADRRADEIIYVASKGNAQEVQVAAQRLNTNLQNITNLAGNEGMKESTVNFRNSAPNSANGTDAVDQNDQQPMLGIATASAPAPAAAPPATTAPAILSGPTQAPAGGSVPLAAPAATTPTPDATPSPPLRAVVPTPSASPNLSASKSSADSTASVSSSEKSIADSGQNARNTNNDSKTSNAANSETSKKDKLKQIIINNFNVRQSRLEEALKNASPQVRPALRQAIAQSQAEYDKALRAIEKGHDDR